MAKPKKATSFSGDLWTSAADVKTNKTAYLWSNVYNISSYSTDYSKTGDPFIVNIPPSLVQSGDNNQVRIYLGESNGTTACPANSTVIYTALFRGSVPAGSVLPELRGGVVRVYYDMDHDGISDGFDNITINGPSFNPSIRTMSELNATATTNALDDAFFRLMNVLNFVVLPTNNDVPGTETNPIDIRLNDISVDTTSTGGIPYAWGPIDIRLDVKI